MYFNNPKFNSIFQIKITYIVNILNTFCYKKKLNEKHAVDNSADTNQIFMQGKTHYNFYFEF